MANTSEYMYQFQATHLELKLFHKTEGFILQAEMLRQSTQVGQAATSGHV